MNAITAAASRLFAPVAALILFSMLGAGCMPSPRPAPAVQTPQESENVLIPSDPTVQETMEPAEKQDLVPLEPQEAEASAPGPDVATRAAILPDPAGAVWREVASGFSNPVDVAAPRDGSGRLFIVEQTGRIRILKNGEILPDPFLDISTRISTGGSEQGLLGVALHPDYPDNGFFFVNYTDAAGNTVIARFRRSADPDRADASSEHVLLSVAQPYANHNGGAVRFGPDGYLYLGLGDGGSGGDPQGYGQNPNSLLGKILRIDVNQLDGYSIPLGNLYTAGEGAAEIYATGMRNPWRFSFDPFNGDLYIGDVGQNQWEEIDLLTAGQGGARNYGWNFYEGSHPFKGTPPAGAEFIPPLWEYDHNQGCSVTGGVVYNGKSLPDWKGVYIYADYCSGLVWGLLKTPEGIQHALFHQTGAAVSSFGEDADGEVYLLDLYGKVYRLEPAN